MRRTLLLFLLTSLTPMMAQNKSFTLEDLTPGGSTYASLQPQKISVSAWKGDLLVVKEDTGYFTYDSKGKKSKYPIITSKKLNAMLRKVNADTIKYLPPIYFDQKDANQARFMANNTWYWLALKEGKITSQMTVEQSDHTFDFNAQQNWTTANQGNGLFLISREGERIEISKDSPEDIVWGQSVHRNEFGIHKGTFWSPDGNKLAFYRMDESMVSEYPIVNTTSRIATVDPIHYPMAGMASHQVTIGIYDIPTGKTTYLHTGEPLDRYFTNLSWTPDSKSILVAELNRAQNEMNLVNYDTQTGDAIKTLFTEKDSKYVEPEHPALFVPNQNDQFIWISERDGYDHLYLYDLEGKELKQLTKGEWLVQDIKAIDPSGRYVFFMATKESPLESNLYRLDLKTGKTLALTADHDGTHHISINGNTKYYYDQFSSPTVPNVQLIGSTTGRSEHVIFEAENPIAEYKMPEIEVGTIKAADGKTDLYYRLIKPVDFDASKKYPAIVYLYNGPHAQLINNGWQAGTRGWDIYMAQKGYVMLTIDGRGSANRGKAFEQAIHWRLGEEEGKDQMKGVELLQDLGYVNMDRIGIHGWSYGGFMTTNMLLTYPNTFKVGVAGGPVMDWKYYEVMYGERYMGHPEANPEGYKNSSMILKAGNLKDHLLIIHGDADPVVLLQNSVEFIRACVNEGVYPDFFIYPGHLHNVMGKDRVHLYEKITRYFEDYL